MQVFDRAVLSTGKKCPKRSLEIEYGHSISDPEVQEAYLAAGIDLALDVATLQLEAEFHKKRRFSISRLLFRASRRSEEP